MKRERPNVLSLRVTDEIMTTLRETQAAMLVSLNRKITMTDVLEAGLELVAQKYLPPKRRPK